MVTILNGWSCGIENYRIKVPLNDIMCLPDFMKIYQTIQKLLLGDAQTDILVIW
jgi:hypothetical protein